MLPGQRIHYNIISNRVMGLITPRSSGQCPFYINRVMGLYHIKVTRSITSKSPGLYHINVTRLPGHQGLTHQGHQVYHIKVTRLPGLSHLGYQVYHTKVTRSITPRLPSLSRHGYQVYHVTVTRFSDDNAAMLAARIMPPRRDQAALLEQRPQTGPGCTARTAPRRDQAALLEQLPDGTRLHC